MIDHIFRETSLGSWKGKKQEEIERDEPELYHVYFHYPKAYRHLILLADLRKCQQQKSAVAKKTYQ
ncbi:histidine phosphatase family protein [Bacillus vallismortis]|nr:histidine phosphatase family protein [Bacillus vallismortis]